MTVSGPTNGMLAFTLEALAIHITQVTHLSSLGSRNLGECILRILNTVGTPQL